MIASELAATFLAHYSGRSLESYRADLRRFLEWPNGVALATSES